MSGSQGSARWAWAPSSSADRRRIARNAAGRKLAARRSSDTRRGRVRRGGSDSAHGRAVSASWAVTVLILPGPGCAASTGTACQGQPSSRPHRGQPACSAAAAARRPGRSGALRWPAGAWHRSTAGDGARGSCGAPRGWARARAGAAGVADGLVHGAHCQVTTADAAIA